MEQGHIIRVLTLMNFGHECCRQHVCKPCVCIVATLRRGVAYELCGTYPDCAYFCMCTCVAYCHGLSWCLCQCIVGIYNQNCTGMPVCCCMFQAAGQFQDWPDLLDDSKSACIMRHQRFESSIVHSNRWTGLNSSQHSF